MKLSEMYKEQMLETMKNIYGNNIDLDKLKIILDNVVSNAKPENTKLWMRNLYTTKNFEINLDDIMDIIKDNDLCIEANNTLTYSSNKIESPISKILIKSKAERNVHKKKMLAYKEEINKEKEAGTFVSGDKADIGQKLENGYQLKVKTFMNSIYGVQGQNGSIIYAPDTAGAVTSQGRELISEMTWTMERLLYGTLHFYSSNEFISYINTLKRECHVDSEYLKYITYYPSVKDVQDQLIKAISKTPSMMSSIKDMSISLFKMINELTEQERIYFYYKNNLFNLISKNVKVFELFDSIINDPTELLVIGGGENFEHFKPTLDLICEIVDEFVICKMSTPNRVSKYQTKRRRAIIVSDTDSVILNLHPYVDNLYKLHCIKNNVPYLGEHVGFFDEKLDFKLVNIIAYICIHGTVVAGDILVKQGNVPQNLRKWIDMKNEFLFKRLAMFSNCKKNYLVNTRLQEGKIIDEVNATGIKLNSSVIHPYVKERIIGIMESELLRKENPDPIVVMKELKNIELEIIQKVKDGDPTLGRKARYSGKNGYKLGVYQSGTGRAAYIWNILYPNMKLSAGDYGYIFDTTVLTEQDVEYKLRRRFPEIATLLEEKIFKNPNEPKLAQYGLEHIMVPISEEFEKLPEWIIHIIDYKRLTNKHLQPLTSFMPSLGLKLSAQTSSKMTYSPLIQF